MITPTDLRKALAGDDPPGKPISLAELGRRLGAHRRNGHAGEPYRKQTIAGYIAEPEKQGADFEEAFLSWRAAERSRRAYLQARFGNLEDLISEAPYIVQLGHGPAQALLVIGALPPGTLIITDGPIPSTVTCRAEIAVCPCGQHFVKRTPRHRWCSPDCTARQVSK